MVVFFLQNVTWHRPMLLYCLTQGKVPPLVASRPTLFRETYSISLFLKLIFLESSDRVIWNWHLTTSQIMQECTQKCFLKIKRHCWLDIWTSYKWWKHEGLGAFSNVYRVGGMRRGVNSWNTIDYGQLFWVTSKNKWDAFCDPCNIL